jgi:hypothetical protein
LQKSEIKECKNSINLVRKRSFLMEEHALKKANNSFNTNIYSYLGTSGGQSSNLYLNVVHFFNTSVNSKSMAA